MCGVFGPSETASLKGVVDLVTWLYLWKIEITKCNNVRHVGILVVMT